MDSRLRFPRRLASAALPLGLGLAWALTTLSPAVCVAQEEAWKRDAMQREQEARRLLERAEAKAASGAVDGAASIFQTVVRRYRKTEAAAEAQFRFALLQDETGNLREAFESYQALIDYFRASPRFSAALEAQLRIARKMLDAHRLRAKRGESNRKRPSSLPAIAEVASMFRIIVSNGRHSDVAPTAQYCLGMALQAAENFKDARDELELFLERYPDDGLADDAAFQLAYMDLLLSRRLRGESSLRGRADLAFRDFLTRYPDSPKAPLAAHWLEVIEDDEAAELARLAAYYERAGNAQAASVYRAQLAQLRGAPGPDSEDIGAAKESGGTLAPGPADPIDEGE